MATLRKRGTKWQVQVRRKGHPAISRSFVRKADAELWARQMEAKADRHEIPLDYKRLETIPMRDLIVRYRDEVVTRKRGVEVETFILNAFLRQNIVHLPLSRIRSHHFSEYRDQRLARMQPVTVRRELGILRHMFSIAAKEWGFQGLANPLDGILMPSGSRPRDRRLMPGDHARLLNAAARGRNPLMVSLVSFAIKTGMRRGEMLNMRWTDIGWSKRTLHIAQTKTGYPRTIPLSRTAIDVLAKAQGAGHNEERVFPMSANAVRLAWERLVRRAHIDDLHFHDLRHEAISRFFEMGLSMPEVALISGHRDMRMLARYTHLRAEEVAKKLA